MLPVIFPQPVFRDLPYFIQCPEQIKIQYFGPVCLVKTFDKGILSRFTRFNKFQYYSMLSAQCASVSDISSGPLSIRIFTGYPRAATILSNTRTTRWAGIFRSISIARASRLKSSSPETPAADQCIMHKINRPA
ncbi:hypothetical protein AC068_04305, partial [Morganella morganii]